jgi:hypothetical protein
VHAIGADFDRLLLPRFVRRLRPHERMVHRLFGTEPEPRRSTQQREREREEREIYVKAVLRGRCRVL